MKTRHRSLLVLHGQSKILSTSFQLRELSRHLTPWFDIYHHEINNVPEARWRYFLERWLKNVAWPRGHDLVLYGNDGVARLPATLASIVYWMDAPADWSARPPAQMDIVQRNRYENIRHCRYLFAVSQTQLRVGKALRPAPRVTEYLPVGVDCARFNPNLPGVITQSENFRKPGKIMIGYLGYLGKRDGRIAGEPILEIAPALSAKHPVHFLIVGHGPAARDWEQRAHAMGLADQFTFTGFIADDLVPAAIAAMDICVDTLEPGFHSEARSETKLKQYMAMGRACVATAIGENVIDLEDGNAGILTQPAAASLLQGVEQLVENSWLRGELGAKARIRAEGVYNWPVLARKMVKTVLDA
ncbi:MAG: glycosyltransferase [Verrucomicrobiota bacterium]|nr:glycosyltransferase [Verrucomicrobiota bacterium]